MNTHTAIVSFKGGAGKSTTTAGLAGQLAHEGRTVLVVDACPTGGVSAALGHSGPFPRGTLADVLKEHRGVDDVLLANGNLWLLPADMALAGVEVDMGKSSTWQDALAKRLAQYVASTFQVPDFVLIDTAPGLGVLPFMALRAARQAVIVCPPDFMSVRVLPHMIATCDRAEAEVLGVIPTMVSNRTKHEREAMAHLRKDYKAIVLPEVPRRVAVQDAALAGDTIQTYEPNSDATAAFARITERITSGN